MPVLNGLHGCWRSFLSLSRSCRLLYRRKPPFCSWETPLLPGTGVETEEAYPSLLTPLLQARGYRDVKIINAGISGSTTASALSRLKWYERIAPRILFLALGANDGLRGLSLTAMTSHLNETIETAISRGMMVILAGMEIPPNYGPDYTRQFREVFPALAAKHGIPLMPFLLKDVAGTQSIQPGGRHPSHSARAQDHCRQCASLYCECP